MSDSTSAVAERPADKRIIDVQVDLPSDEQAALDRAERVIAKGVRIFVEVGRALAEIRDRHLYRALHRTFEKYCGARWGFSRQRAYQLIDAAGVVSEMSTIVDKPATESVARELAKAPPTERERVWQQAVERHGDKPTAKQTHDVVAEVVGDAKPKPRGTDGAPVVRHPASTALQFAQMATSQLERVQPDDPDRDAAYKRVLSWIAERRPPPPADADPGAADALCARLEWHVRNWLGATDECTAMMAAAFLDRIAAMLRAEGTER